MSEWQNFKLREVGTLQRGRSRHRPRYAFHLFNGPYPFIQTGEVREARKYVSTFENTYSEAGLAQSKLWPKGTLCITIAANIAELAILGFDACFPDSVLGFIPDETRSDLDFVYYTLTHFQKQLKHIGEGSVQDNINLGTFEDIEFPFPSLTEQKAIASVLSSLDDKIDLLHRQNKTLEAMAETLFRQWFIEEAKEDWELESLGHHIQTINGVSYKSSELNPSNIALVTLKNFGRNGGLRTDGFKEFTGTFKDSQIMEDGDIAVAHTDLTQDASLIGNPIYILNLSNYDKLVISMDLVKVNLDSNTITKCFLFHLLKSTDFKDYALACSNGSSVIHLSKKALPSFKFKCPPTEKIGRFTNLVDPMDQKIQKNIKQIQTLENLRDTLLPKLMSGEVRVQYQTEEVA